MTTQEKAREAFEATHTGLVRLLDEEGSYTDPETSRCYEQFFMGWQASRARTLYDVLEQFGTEYGTLTAYSVRLRVKELINEQW
jgi:hypothetical protein